MDCETCDRIFSNIRLVDHIVDTLKRIRDSYSYQLVWARISGAHRIAIKDLEESLEEAIKNHIEAKWDKKEIHKSLTKHYREDHLNGE